MWKHVVLIIGVVALPSLAAAEEKLKEHTPTEARKAIGKEITVHMKVVSAKDRLEKRGEIYLDSQEDFKDEKNFAVVITRKGAESLKAAGIADPAQHYFPDPVRRARLAAVPHAEVSVLPGSHHLHMDQPGTVGPLLRDFLAA